jgi:hypothetical protein
MSKDQRVRGPDDETKICLELCELKGGIHLLGVIKLTGSIALNRCVMKVAPFFTAASPWHKLPMEWPTDTVMFLFDSSWTTSGALGSSGARVIMLTESKLPYVSKSD